MSSKKRGFAFLIASLAIFAASPVFGATITVTSTSDSGSGTLRAAIAAAAPGDTIKFNLTYPATIMLSSFLTISNNLTITGPGASNLAISGGHAVGLLQITAGTVTISGLTMENGYNPLANITTVHGIYNTAALTIINSVVTGNGGGFYGGGILNSGTLTVINTAISGNGATIGAGIWNEGTASITGSTISGNPGGQCGGGIYSSGTITISNSSVSNNYTNAFGGGICNDGTLTITNSTVSGNNADDGAGIWSGFGLNGPSANSVTITNSTISNNVGASGVGGVYGGDKLIVTNSTLTGNLGGEGAILGGAVTVINSTISGNFAIYFAGGVGGETLTITNSTITNNSAFYPGAGIYGNGFTTIKNTIVAGNTFGGLNTPGGNCSFTGTVTSDGHNLSDDTSCMDFFNGVGDLNNSASGLDPAGLKNNGGPTQTIALVSGLAIYAIPLAPVNYCTLTDGTTPVANDQRGVTRPQSPKGCSIGAFEPESASAYSLLQALYTTLEAQIKALPHPDSDKHDGDHDRDRDRERDHDQAKDVRQQLTEAAGEISEMLGAKDWAGTDGNHLVRDRAFRFFVDDHEAAENLSRILHDHDHDRDDDSVIPPQSIQNDLQSLVSANRKLAVTAIAGAAGKNPELLARAKAKLADGDGDAAGGHYERAIDNFEKAWSLAENAL